MFNSNSDLNILPRFSSVLELVTRVVAQNEIYNHMHYKQFPLMSNDKCTYDCVTFIVKINKLIGIVLIFFTSI